MRPFPAVRKLSSCPRLGHDMQMRPDRPFILHVGTSAPRAMRRGRCVVLCRRGRWLACAFVPVRPAE
jgi:hypothetical protein